MLKILPCCRSVNHSKDTNLSCAKLKLFKSQIEHNYYYHELFTTIAYYTSNFWVILANRKTRTKNTYIWIPSSLVVNLLMLLCCSIGFCIFFISVFAFVCFCHLEFDTEVSKRKILNRLYYCEKVTDVKSHYQNDKH